MKQRVEKLYCALAPYYEHDQGTAEVEQSPCNAECQSEFSNADVINAYLY